MRRLARTLSLLLGLACALPAWAQQLTVAADSSLGGALQEVARAFQALHPGVTVRLNLAASGVLLEQIAEGKAADVYASTDGETLARGIERHLLRADGAREFATNTLLLVVPGGRSSPVQRLADLARPEVRRISMGRPAGVPAGRYARQAIDGARLWPAVQRKVAMTDDGPEALALVARAEVDAGFAFQTDALTAADRVRVIQTLTLPLPPRHAAAVVAGSAQATLAREFVAYLTGNPARAVFTRLGFGEP
jgi:molybdate transport system substrate-binding protein